MPSNNRLADLSPALVADGLSFPEGPAYNARTGDVIVSECNGARLTRIAPNGTVSVYAEANAATESDDSAEPWTFRKPNGATFGADGAQYVCDFGRCAIVKIAPSGNEAGPGLQTAYATDCDGAPFRGPNDLAFDPDGNLYFTDPTGSGRDNPVGAVYRVEAQTQRVTRVADGLAFPNGLAVSGDGRYLFLCESQQTRVLRYEIGASGALLNPQLAADLMTANGPGDPDGMALDVDGNLYVAHYGGAGVVVFAPDGAHIGTVGVTGRNVTNVEWVGGDLSTLFITEAQEGKVYTVRAPLGVPGLPLFG